MVGNFYELNQINIDSRFLQNSSVSYKPNKHRFKVSSELLRFLQTLQNFILNLKQAKLRKSGQPHSHRSMAFKKLY
jgi:hypothetical protein